MKINPADQRRFELQISELIRTGKMPSLEQVQTAIETTRQEFFPVSECGQEQGEPMSRTSSNEYRNGSLWKMKREGPSAPVEAKARESIVITVARQ